MLDAFLHNLIESFADAIVGISVTVADDHQQRRVKLAEYEAEARRHAGLLLTRVAEEVSIAVRNRYAERLSHPRLGHEPLSAELRAAEIGLNEAVVALKASASPTNRALGTAASIRLTAITKVMGGACIYSEVAARPGPVTAKKVKKTIRANDKRLNRRAPTIGDVPETLLLVIAQLGTSHPNRTAALGELEAQRAGPLDVNGIVTRVAALAGLADHQDMIDQLAAQASTALSAKVPPIATDPALPSSECDAAAGSAPRSMPTAAKVAATNNIVVPVAAPIDALDPETVRAIATVAGFVDRNRWALKQRDGVYSLEKLGKRADINASFDRLASLPEMQDALRRIHASASPAKS